MAVRRFSEIFELLDFFQLNCIFNERVCACIGGKNGLVSFSFGSLRCSKVKKTWAWRKKLSCCLFHPSRSDRLLAQAGGGEVSFFSEVFSSCLNFSNSTARLMKVCACVRIKRGLFSLKVKKSVYGEKIVLLSFSFLRLDRASIFASWP